MQAADKGESGSPGAPWEHLQLLPGWNGCAFPSLALCMFNHERGLLRPPVPDRNKGPGFPLHTRETGTHAASWLLAPGHRDPSHSPARSPGVLAHLRTAQVSPNTKVRCGCLCFPKLTCVHLGACALPRKYRPPQLTRGDLGFFHFVVGPRLWAFCRNCTWHLEFKSFPGLVLHSASSLQCWAVGTCAHEGKPPAP